MKTWKYMKYIMDLRCQINCENMLWGRVATRVFIAIKHGNTRDLDLFYEWKTRSSFVEVTGDINHIVAGEIGCMKLQEQNLSKRMRI